MTRRPKTPRTPRQTALLVVSNIFGARIGGGFRRQPKGRRAKSGQWAKRTPCPVKLGDAVERTIKAMHRRRMAIEALQRIAAERRVVIDEATDDSGQVWELLDRLNPKLTSGTVIEATTNDRSDKP